MKGVSVACTLLAGVVSTGAALAQWTAVNIHPPVAAYVESRVYAIDGLMPYGMVAVPFNWLSLPSQRAVQWAGLSGNVVALPMNASGTVMGAEVRSAAGGQQVGIISMMGGQAAALWTGPSGPLVILNTGTFGAALDTDGVRQVGFDSIGFLGSPQAALWSGSAASRIILHPPGAASSVAEGVSGSDQVGSAAFSSGPSPRAALWHGSAASWTDLHPPGADASYAHDVSSGLIGGEIVYAGSSRAAIAFGLPPTWISLHPPGAIQSRVFGVSGPYQVGEVENFHSPPRAALWASSAASYVNLHSFLPPGVYASSSARAIASDGSNYYVVGWGYNTQTGRNEAIVWHRTTRCPGAGRNACSPADWNEDGLVDYNDFLVFSNYWNLEHPCADLNQDGIVDFSDFLDYMNLYNQGC